MSVALVIVTDGREDFYERTLASLPRMLPGIDHRIVVDDSSHALGFAGAVDQGWREVLASGVDWVFWLEDDFVLLEQPPVNPMIALLEGYPYLAQVALKRQPVNDREIAAGGIVEADPDDFTERSDSCATWTEHRRYFTTNPSMYSSRLCRLGWPRESNSEGVFTHRLLADPLLKFAVWGGKFDPPRVEHVGRRCGVGY